MSAKDPTPIIWTPFQRQSVLHFLRLYTDELEKAKDNPDKGFGLEGIQKGILHLADKVFPTGQKYVVNQGIQGPALGSVRVIYSDNDLKEFEKSRSGEDDEEL